MNQKINTITFKPKQLLVIMTVWQNLHEQWKHEGQRQKPLVS